ncbi:GIN domain-containing protein [Sphingomonas flavalba]|uniref:GIN domain-containing protein n=1 Tax=Sphingomonas flavalba TaxID=2559804 RepID=UPI00109E243C|nr:DUF2807 domain-containing protein [Sphingomonas flavalba]
MPSRCALLIAALSAAAPAAAAERTIGITSFDRILVEGPYAVSVVTGRAVSARATGALRGLDGLSLSVDGTTLRVRTSGGAWGGYPGEAAGPVRLALTTPALTVARVLGSGALTVDAMRGARVSLGVEGAGTLAVARIDADRADLALAGSGSLTAAGTVKAANAVVRGNGLLDAGRLAANDITVNSQGGGQVTARAGHAATVAANGTGDVTILGAPACTVQHQGSGTVRCGDAPPR